MFHYPRDGKRKSISGRFALPPQEKPTIDRYRFNNADDYLLGQTAITSLLVYRRTGRNSAQDRQVQSEI